MFKRVALTLLIGSSLFAADPISQAELDAINSLPSFSDKTIDLPSRVGKTNTKNLPLFGISCREIKYTGAYEQIWIDMLEDSKTYIKEVIEPYTTLSKLDAAVFTYAFGKCFMEEAEAEITGDETHSSLTQKLTEALGEADNGFVLNLGVTSSPQASINVETESNIKVDVAGTTSKATEKSGEEGLYQNVVRCIMDEREKAYLQLYNLLSYSLKMKWVMGSAVGEACNVPLKQAGETIPSWSEMTGISFQGIKDKIFPSDSNEEPEKKSRAAEFMKEYFEEVFAFDVTTNSEMCVKFDLTTGKCQEKETIKRGECKTNDEGFLVGGCDCVQGVDIMTGKSCSLPADYKFNNDYGVTIDYSTATSNNIDVSLAEKYFLDILLNSSYIDSEVPYRFFFNNDELIIIKWNIFLDKKRGYVNFNLNPTDNFRLEVSDFETKVLSVKDPKEFILRTSNRIMKTDSEFDKALIGVLAINECGGNDICEATVFNDKYIKEDKFNNVGVKYIEFKKKYESTLNFVGNSYKFYPTLENYKKKVYNIQLALKDMFGSKHVSRTVAFQNDFLNNFLIKVIQRENFMKFKKAPEKDIWILKNFAKRFYLSFPSSNDNLEIFNEQMYQMANQTFPEKKKNLKFMKLNSLIEAEKTSLIKTLYDKR